MSAAASFEAVQFNQDNDPLKHRGPDAGGCVVHDRMILRHRRLSITDAGFSGNQPMLSACGRYHVVFNGEIYNHQTLKKEIQQLKPALQFKSSSDTEVVLESFAIWGANAVYKWDGMFSLAIWDIQEECLWLFRDRMGEKPLYYFYNDEYFVFASELKVIEQLPFFNRNINKDSIIKYLHLGIVPDPSTIYEHVYKMQAGTYLSLTGGEIFEKSFWEIKNCIHPVVVKDEETAMHELEGLLRQSVSERLSKDLVNGIFLSGGIDSSVIAAMAAQNSDSKLMSFSLGFDRSPYNENKYGEDIAAYLGIKHHSVSATLAEAAVEFHNLTDVFDEPFADSSALAVLLLSKFAKDHVKVVLSGEGGDELFLGYGRYNWSKYLSNPLLWKSRHLVSMVLSNGNQRHQKAAGLFDVERKNIYSHTISHDHQLFSLNVLNENFIGFHEPQFEFDEKLNRQLSFAEKQALFEMSFYLKDDLLVKLDRSAMYYSLETRCPFLDESLVSFALNLPPSLKIKNEEQKYLLKKVLFRHIPKHYFDRRKQGFAIPLAKLLQTDLSYLLDEYLNDDIVKKAEFFKPSFISALKKQFRNGSEMLANKLWALVLLHKWFVQKML